MKAWAVKREKTEGDAVAETEALSETEVVFPDAADAFDEMDGNALGRILYLRLYKHRQNPDDLSSKILEMIRMTNVLRSAQAKYR